VGNGVRPLPVPVQAPAGPTIGTVTSQEAVVGSRAYPQPRKEAENMANLLDELNNDIWLPFSHAYAEGDIERYLGLHAPDFTWIRAEERIIEGLDDYRARIRQSFANLPAGITLYLAFRFTERIVSPLLASERGIARMSGDGPRGPLPVRYSRFHTIARRDSDHWRLVVDYDGGPADPADFETAHPVDDQAPFTASRR
jgi:ketosteroid isomerase-like protein